MGQKLAVSIDLDEDQIKAAIAIWVKQQMDLGTVIDKLEVSIHAYEKTDMRGDPCGHTVTAKATWLR